MDLEVLNLKVEAQAVERATRDLEDMGVALDKVDRAALKLNDTNKVLRGEQLRVAGSSVKVSDALTKTQAGFLAMMKQAGASVAEIRHLSKEFENMNKMMGINTFDKSANALARMRKQTEELTKSMKYIEKYNDLTKQQISLLTQGIEATRQRAISEGKNFGDREAAVKRFIKEFVKEAQAYNQVTATIDEKNRVVREEIRLQEEAARAAQVSAKQRVDAEKYLQETLQKTLFMNEQMDKGVNQSTASALYEYKQRIDLLGLSADQAAAKMQEFQTALNIRKSLRGTTEEVNHLARAVGVQLGDVFVSLAGGMNPFLVMIQQGDQMRFALDQAKASGQSLDKVMQGAFVNIANSFKMVGGIVKDFVVDAFSSAGSMVARFNTAIIDAAGNMVGLGNVMTNQIKKLEEGAVAGSKLDKAMLGVMSTAKILAGGLLLGIVAAIATFAVGSVKLSNDLDKLAVALNTTGASLGLTAQQAQLSAEKIGETYGTNIYDALDAVTLFATKNVQFTDEMIVSATELSRVTGKSLSDIIDSYASLKGKPVEGLLDVAIATGQVNIETVKQIDKLVEQGETAKAVELAMKEKARAEQEAARNTIAEMTPLGQLWLQMKKDVSSLSDAVYDIVTKSALVDVFRTAWEAVAVITSEVWYVLKQMGNEIGGIFAQIASVLSTKSFSGAKAIREMMLEDADAAREAQDDLVASILSRGKTEEDVAKRELEAAAKRREDSAATAAQYKKEYESRKKGADEAGKEAEKTQKYFGKLMEGATDLALRTQQEVSKLNSGYEQMADSQKMLFDAQNDPRWNTLTERQKAEFGNTLKLIEANEELIRQYKAQVALQEVLSKWVDDYDSVATSIKEEVDALKLRNDLLFKTEDEAKAIQRQYDLNVKLAAVENKYIERRNKMMMDYVDLVKEGNWSPEALVEYQRNMSAVNQQEAQERELVHKDVNTQIVEDYEQKFKEIQGTVTDIIATALFEGGKAGSKKLKDVLNQSFRNYVIDVFINPIVGSTMGSITGGAGMSGQSSGGVTGIISNASSAYNLATGSAVAGISSAVQGAGAFLGSSAVSSFGAGMTMTGTQVAALSEAGLVASKGAASLGSTFGAVMPWIAGGLLVADLLGVFDKKPSDKTSAVTVDLSNNAVKDIWDMGGKKTAPQEQKDANVVLSQVVGGFAKIAGITGELVTAVGSRDGIRVAITGGFDTPEGAAAGGAWLGGKETAYAYGSDMETAVAAMLSDLIDEGTLDQAVIDSWNSLKTATSGVTKDAVELIGNLSLLVAGYDEQSIKRADLLQLENESIEVAYARMLQYEKALSGMALPGDALADSAKALVRSFENLNVSVPTTAEQLNSLISALDLTTSSGQASYVALMNLVPAFLELKNAQEELYNQLLTDEQKASLLAQDVGKAFSQLGVSMPKTRDEMRKIIDAQDASTQAGAYLKAQLLGLVPAFIEVTLAAEESSKAFVENANALAEEAMSGVDKAFQALQKAVEAEKKIVDARIKSLTDNLTRLKAVFDFIKNAIDGLLRSVSSTNAMQISQANALIKSVVVSGIIPDDKSLEDAVSIAVEGVEKGIYASRADQERATILLANDLSKINAGVGDQVSETERLIRIEERELLRLENILTKAQEQINALNEINGSIMSVEEAINNFAAATLNANTAKINAAAASASSLDSMTSPSQARDAGFITSPVNQYGSFTGIGDSGYRLQTTAGGATLLFPGGGSHSVSGTNAAQTLTQTYGLTSSGLQGTLIRTRAKGGYTPPGMTLVGEEGPELVNFRNPSMVYTASQTSSLLSGGGNLEEAIDALRDEMIMLRAETRAVALNTSKSAKLLDRAMPDGQSILVTTTA